MFRLTSIALALATVMTARPALAEDSLAQAQRDFPPLILGGTVHAGDGSGPYPPSCPQSGSVQQRGGPTTEYFGSVTGEPDLCVLHIGGQPVKAWFGIWLTIWPGAEMAHGAMQTLIHSPAGTMAGFDVNMGPGHLFHDVMRNDGIEDIVLRGRTYSAIKISHYRAGAGGNRYRSVTTGWKDLGTGMLIYVSYQHISGTPEIDVPLIPTAILPTN